MLSSSTFFIMTLRYDCPGDDAVDFNLFAARISLREIHSRLVHPFIKTSLFLHIFQQK